MIDAKRISDEASKPFTILAGHSAGSGLMHKKMYERLKFIAKESVEIVSVLVYPDMGEYTLKVIDYGQKIFGENIYTE